MTRGEEGLSASRRSGSTAPFACILLRATPASFTKADACGGYRGGGTADGRHPRVVPSTSLLDETEEVPLGHHDGVQIQPAHLVLVRHGIKSTDSSTNQS